MSNKDQLLKLIERFRMIEIDSLPLLFKNRSFRMISNINNQPSSRPLLKVHKSLENLRLNHRDRSKSLSPRLSRRDMSSNQSNRLSNLSSSQFISNSQCRWSRHHLSNSSCHSNRLDTSCPTNNNNNLNITKVLLLRTNLFRSSNNSQFSAQLGNLQLDKCHKVNHLLTLDQSWSSNNNSQTLTVSHLPDSSKRRRARTSTRLDREMSHSETTLRRRLTIQEPRVPHVMPWENSSSTPPSQEPEPLEIEAPTSTRLPPSQDTTPRPRLDTHRSSPRHLEAWLHQCSSRRRSQSACSRSNLMEVKTFNSWESSRDRSPRRSLKSLATNSTSVRTPSTSFWAESTNNCSSD